MKIFYVILFFVLTAIVLFSPHLVQLPAVLPSLALGKDVTNLYHSLNLMAPFAAVLGAVATFIAFYVQYSANQTLQKENSELHKKNRIDVVTAHFFELLRLHKENVNELTWKEAAGGNELGSAVSEESDNQAENTSLDDIDVFPEERGESEESKPAMKYFDSLVQRQGKFLFDYCLTEFNLIYVLYKDYIQNACKIKMNWKETIKNAYDYFYKRRSINGFNIEGQLRQIYQNLKNSNSYSVFCETCKGSFVILDEEVKKVIKKVFLTRQYFSVLPESHRPIDMLNQYYRHLYMTVKYVVTNTELEYEKKRELLRILRAQMSRQEQILLFYNWISGNGIQWEKMDGKDKQSDNHFFTDYRMIHNMYPGDCIFLEFLCNSKVAEKWYPQNEEEDILKSRYFICLFMNNSKGCADRNWKCEKEKDSLFEFEDWKGYPTFGQPKKDDLKLRKKGFCSRWLDKIKIIIRVMRLCANENTNVAQQIIDAVSKRRCR